LGGIEVIPMMLGMYVNDMMSWWYPNAWWFFTLLWFFLLAYFILMIYTIIRIWQDREEIPLFILAILLFFIVPAGALFLIFYWIEKGVKRKKPV
jgi:hypothetical protein